MRHYALFNKKFRIYQIVHETDPIVSLLDIYREMNNISSFQFHRVFLALRIRLGIDYTTKCPDWNYERFVPYLKFRAGNKFGKKKGLYPLLGAPEGVLTEVEECYTLLVPELMKFIVEISVENMLEYLEIEL